MRQEVKSIDSSVVEHGLEKTPLKSDIYGLSRTRSIDPKLGQLHSKVAYHYNEGANLLPLFNVC